MILRVLNIGRVEARTCSTWSVGMEDESQWEVEYLGEIIGNYNYYLPL